MTDNQFGRLALLLGMYDHPSYEEVHNVASDEIQRLRSLLDRVLGELVELRAEKERLLARRLADGARTR